MEAKYTDRNRDKAFWGSVIGAATGIIGGLFGRKKAKKQAEAQRQAEYINYQNQQNAINTQYQSQQNAIDAQYRQNVLNVEAQEKLNREQNELAAKKTGIENASGLTALYANEAELNNEFRNRFMRCGGKRKKSKCGGRKKAGYGWTDNDTSDAISSAGNLIGGVIGNSVNYTPTAYKLNYKANTYKTYKPADIQVYDDVADKFSGRNVGENNAKYANAQNNNMAAMTTLGQNPSAAITAASSYLYQQRYACGGRKKMRKHAR